MGCLGALVFASILIVAMRDIGTTINGLSMPAYDT
jgi:hypothetical protein